jgi:hypothetical protein
MTMAPRANFPLADAAQSPPTLKPAELSDVELGAWVQRSMFAAGLAPRFTLRRYRWRRVHFATTRELSARLLRHGAPANLCDVCGEPRATHHLIRDGETGSIFEHHCSECSSKVAAGWYSCVTTG